MRSSGRREEEEGDEQGWLMSYGDMMSLLLCFFVLIVSYSVVEIVKFRQAMGSMRGTMGVLTDDAGAKVVKSEAHSMFERPLLKKDLLVFARSRELMMGLISKETKGIEVFPASNGVRFRITSPLLFDTGTNRLKPTAHEVLGEIAGLIRDISCDVRVEGHTDNSPIHTAEYPSNWELSAARALAVVKYFVREEDLDPTRLWIAGYGENRPIVPNNNVANRARNRRVEIFLDWGGGANSTAFGSGEKWQNQW